MQTQGLITMMKSKLHNVLVTDAKLDYVGSVTIDENLMDAVGLFPAEKVLIVNNNNGNRIETYVIKGKRGTGVICLNGAAAHKFATGDIAIIMSFAHIYAGDATAHKPKVVFPYNNNTSFRTPEEVTKQIIQDTGLAEFTISFIEQLALQMAFTEDEIKQFIVELGLTHE